MAKKWLAVLILVTLVAIGPFAALTGAGAAAPAADGGYRVYLPLMFGPTTSTVQQYVYSDDFSSTTSGWYQYAGGPKVSVGSWPQEPSSTIDYSYQAGEYQIIITDPSKFWAGWATRALPDLASYSVEADVRAANQYVTQLGLVFGGVSTNQHYRFVVDGTAFTLFRYDTTTLVPLLSETSAAIKPLAEVNHLKVARAGSSITLYANGQFLTRVTDGTYQYGGAGFVAQSAGSDPATARFDNILVNGYAVGASVSQEGRGVAGMAGDAFLTGAEEAR